jgi:hypothetical protein
MVSRGEQRRRHPLERVNEWAGPKAETEENNEQRGERDSLAKQD